MREIVKLPQIRTAKDKTVAELAIFILSHEWPLPLKSLHWKIRKEQGREVSFQATHKALSRLVEQNIIVKRKLAYQLNTEWLEQLAKFSYQTKQQYLEKDESFFENAP